MIKVIILMVIAATLLDFLFCRVVNKYIEVQREIFKQNEKINKNLDMIAGFLEEIRDKLNNR